MSDVLDASAIRHQLQRILDCEGFTASQRSKRLLTFLVEETLAGRGDRLKGFYIACECLGRDADFDPLTDPIVRIEMGKLRRALEHYYLSAGREDGLQIVLPKGNYQPLFLTDVGHTALSQVEEHAAAGSELAWFSQASLAIPPFSGNEAAAELAEGLRQQIAAQLNRLDDVYVLIPDEPGTEAKARFSLLGQVRAQGEQARIGLQLVDNLTHAQCWALTCTESLADPFALEDRLALAVVNRIADPHHGEMLRALAQGERQSPAVLVARFNTEHLRHLWDADWQQTARAELQRLLDQQPDFAAVHAALARAYHDAYLIGQLELDCMSAALLHAQRAVQLEPDSPHAYSALANACKVLGDKPGALWAIERTLALSPAGNSMHVIAALKYLSLGELERGEALIQQCLRHESSRQDGLYLGLALLHRVREEITEAVAAIERYRLPDTFWSLLLKTACLARAGQTPAARSAHAHLLARCPDFARRPRRYLQAALSVEAWVDLLEADLARLGTA